MILPAMGVISELIPTFARKQLFGYHFVAAASLAIAVIGFLVWTHHMFLTGQSTYAALVFSFLTFLVAIPSAVKTFNWVATLYGGSISVRHDRCSTHFGFLGLFLIGGLTGLFLGCPRHGHPHPRYLLRCRALHYIMVGGAIMGYRRRLAFLVAEDDPAGCTRNGWREFPRLILFVGFNLTFFPAILAWLSGHAAPLITSIPPEFQVYNVMSTAGASILAIGYLLPMIYLTWAAFCGKVAGDNPWPATGLEWKPSRRRSRRILR